MQTYQFVDINGTKIHYQTVGSGEAVVFLHAGIGHLEMWDDQIDTFTQHYRVIRCDLRGFGQSPAVDGPFARYADLHGLLTHLGIEKATLIGASIGGRLAIDFALVYPKMVTALVLICPALGGYEYQFIEGKLAELDAKIDEAYEAGDLALTAELETHLWVDGLARSADDLDPVFRAKAHTMNVYTYQLPQEVGTEVRLDPPAISRLGEIQVPTLAIIGAEDIKDMHAVTDTIVAGIDQTQKVVIPHTAHLPSMEHPAEFNQRVLAFLESNC